MDPNTAIMAIVYHAECIRHAADRDKAIDETDAIALVDYVIALDEWLRKGGFLPERWKQTIEQPKE